MDNFNNYTTCEKCFSLYDSKLYFNKCPFCNISCDNSQRLTTFPSSDYYDSVSISNRLKNSIYPKQKNRRIICRVTNTNNNNINLRTTMPINVNNYINYYQNNYFPNSKSFFNLNKNNNIKTSFIFEQNLQSKSLPNIKMLYHDVPIFYKSERTPGDSKPKSKQEHEISYKKLLRKKMERISLNRNFSSEKNLHSFYITNKNDKEPQDNLSPKKKIILPKINIKKNGSSVFRNIINITDSKIKNTKPFISGEKKLCRKMNILNNKKKNSLKEMNKINNLKDRQTNQIKIAKCERIPLDNFTGKKNNKKIMIKNYITDNNKNIHKNSDKNNSNIKNNNNTSSLNTNIKSTLRKIYINKNKKANIIKKKKLSIPKIRKYLESLNDIPSLYSKRKSFDCIMENKIYGILNEEISFNSFDSNDFNIIELIGQGSYAKIYLVENQKTKKKFALKKVIIKNDNDLLKNQDEYILTMKLMEKNPDLKIVKKYGIEMKKLDKFNSVMYILMESAICDWEKEIINRKNNNNFYTEKEILKILKNLVNTFAILQEKGISHRDIKPQNILYFGNLEFKITDFGEAADNNYEINKNYDINTKKQTIRGTELYMSPILFNALQVKILEGVYNAFKSDVFSLGMCFLYVSTLNLESLYEIREEVNMENIKKSVNQYLGEKYTNDYINLLISMLNVDEKNRPDFLELNSMLDAICCEE